MPPRKHRKRRMGRRLLIWIGGGLATIVALPLIALGVLILTVDPNSYKSRIEQAMQQATGRDLVIHGPLSVTPGWSPVVTAQDVTLANMPSGSRPDMLRVDEMQVELALRPLLRGHIVVARMVLLHPDILLETDAAGRDNWHFRRPARPIQVAAPPAASTPAVVPQAPASPAAPAEARLLLQTLHVHDGRLTWRNGATGVATVIDIGRISATAASAESPVAVSADFTVNRHHLAVTAQTGPLSRLAGRSEEMPWALFMNIENDGAKFTLAGSVARPLDLHGYSLRVDGSAPDLGTLAWISPVKLPPLHNVIFSARLLDQGGALPDVSAVTLQAGPTVLDEISPGFTLDAARLDMPSLTDPVAIVADGAYAGTPLHLRGTIGAPAALLPPALLPASIRSTGAFSLDMTAELAGASFAMRGGIASPNLKSGMDIAIGARVPDLSLLSPLAGHTLPALKTLAFSAHLTDGGRGYRDAVGLQSLVLTLPEGDLSGNATLTFGGRPGLQAVLNSTRIDADALLALFATAAKANVAAPVAPPTTSQAADATLPPPLPRHIDTIIPDTALPFRLLGRADIDVTARIGTLVLGGMTTTDVSGHVMTLDGKLAAGPIQATLPGGPASAALTVDSRQPTPLVGLSLATPGIDLKTLLAALGVVDPPGGRLELRADLHGAGLTPHLLASSLNGMAAAALVNADMNNAMFAALLGDVLRAGRLPDFGADIGRTRLRCVALRLTAVNGTASLDTGVLDSDRLLLNAAGKADLGAETMALRLRPMLRTGPGIVVPVRLDGDFKAPKLALDSSGVAENNAKTALGVAAGLLGGKNVAQVLAAERAGSGDACTPALAAVRAP